MNTPLSPADGGIELVAGWGRGTGSTTRVEHIESQEELARVVTIARNNATPILARGLGRSYGEAAQCAGGTVLECAPLDRVLEADLDSGIVRVEAGVSLDALLALVVPAGWFVPVTPGTRQVTIGGAFATDVHGKNHHRDGTFGVGVERLTLVTARGPLEVSPASLPDLYWASMGGMGLTGAIAEATLRLCPIETAFMAVDTTRVGNLEDCMAELSASDDRYRYSVAWVDCGARERQLGRSLLSRGDHARLADLPTRQQDHAFDYRPSTPLNVPITSPFNLVVPAAVSAGKALWYRKAPLQSVGEIQSLSSFFYPLDAVANRNRLYGPQGFTQYQFVVPFGEEPIIRKAIEHLHACGVGPSLGVLQRFGEADPAPLSFPIPGWTLSLDLPLGGPAIGPVLNQLDLIVAKAGGRVYLAKDGQLRPELFKTMYPRLGEWLETRARYDPTGIFVSDLARHLHIVNG